jgi:epoxyqueuosine reductase
LKREPDDCRTAGEAVACNLFQALAERGYAASMVASSRAPELRDTLEAQRREGLFDEKFYQQYLKDFDFSPPKDLPDACSILVAAIPQPQIRFAFNLRGRRIEAIVPPTYLGFVQAESDLRDTIMTFIGPQGYTLAPAALPRKLLAVCGGLAEYGKNNITYVPGMGSFHRLAAFYTDLPCREDNWRQPVTMERCRRCTACARCCPTGAIAPDRFLLHADKCIVFHNEQARDVPFPDWIDPRWHNCLIGCMLCQRACPENGGVVDWFEDGAEFTEEETGILLNVDPREALESPESLPPRLLRKLKHTDLFWELETLPRNLRALAEFGN